MAHATAYDENEILDAFDRAASRYRFIILDGGKGRPGDVRITIYRDPTRWVMVQEDLEFYNVCPGHEDIVDSIIKIGNCVQVSNARTGTDSDELRVTSDGHGPPAFLPPHSLAVNPEVQSIRIRGKLVPVDLSDEALTRRCIPRPEGGWFNYRDHVTGEIVRKWAPPKLGGYHLLWSLLPEHREDLLATEDEKLRRLPVDLPKFTQLEKWHHPEFLIERSSPSDSETFRLLAKAIAAGDLGEYRPTLPPNTHWRNWMDHDRV